MSNNDADRHAAGVVQMVEDGMSWGVIADKLGVTVEDAMQRYRDEAFDYWDTGWELDPDLDATASFSSGDVHWESGFEGDSTVLIEEIAGKDVPLYTIIEDGETEVHTYAKLSPEEARQLASVLLECADIAEGKK